MKNNNIILKGTSVSRFIYFQFYNILNKIIIGGVVVVVVVVENQPIWREIYKNLKITKSQQIYILNN